MYNQYYMFYGFVNILYLYSFLLKEYVLGDWSRVYDLQLFYSVVVTSCIAFTPIIWKWLKPNNALACESSTPRFLSIRYMLIAIIAIGIEFYLFNYSGADLTTYFDRSNRELDFFVSQTFVIFILILQFYFFYSIYYFKSISFFGRLIFWVLFLSFLYFEFVVLGARRYSIAVILFYLFRYDKFKEIFKFKYLIPAFVLFFTVFVFGGIREIILKGETLSIQSVLEVALRDNEFTEIGRGLYYYIYNNYNLEILSLGKTLIDGIQYIIPRSMHFDKPLSIVSQFGMPASIYSELFLNFHIIGSLFFMVHAVIFYSISNKKTFISCIFAAFTLDFIRTDFGSIIYTVIVMTVLSLIFQKNYSLDKIN
ncbi:hypothetical protein RGL58_001901 [Vibrio parahaemolyticus]|uniref:Oligosaccharide repeat unit polymerase n=1 Tax=Vibrio parahaemolyticus TaxID=670 RepID=A0A7M1VMD6_VIBPH|nr:hypothetical protein [Vibrio parahaemolyticus]QOS16362.1 hypothetical protein VP52_00010 [Vibrio parahaemolyticus]